ncbi:MAG: hypothetical protein NT151_11675 [Acidobacteria bacterium]|nr:hypothetical protein [Acidobacteriota bacterium]
MAETEARQTLCFTASFPMEAYFAPTAGELASCLAVSAGLAEDDANAIGRSVETAFTKALNGQSVEGAPAIDVSLCAGETTLDLSVCCGSTSVLTLSHPMPQ